jgi:hypothetical protein
VDANNNTHEFEGVVSIDANDSVYNLQNISEIVLNNTLNGNNSIIPVTRPPITANYTSSPSTLTALYADIAKGYSQLTQS